jgi:hypothetical protein
MRRAPAAALLALLLVVPFSAPARAADPIMSLSDVRSGMRCTGYSVVHGVDISSFDVEVMDVVASSASDPEPRILVRVSGAAVDPWGIAEGFSGSPVVCPDANGVPRTIGALAYSVGQYGDSIGLATPIELIVGEPVDVPKGARHAPTLLRGARPVASPLSIGGLNPVLGKLVENAGRIAGRTVRVAPGGPAGGIPVRPLQPGSSVVAGLATGSLSAGALGTVSYVDGSSVWAFGHAFEGVGARSLLLEDAWIYTVVYNPNNTDSAASYKLGSAGREVGTLTNDGFDAIAGRLGQSPPQIDLRFLGRDLDTGRRAGLVSRVADESALQSPGGDVLPLLTQLALLQGDALALRASPPAQSGTLCVRVKIAGRDAPLRFCNRYVGGGDGSGDAVDGGSGALTRMSTDVTQALSLVSSFDGAPPRIERIGLDLRVHRGLDQAFLVGARAPARVRAGAAVPVRLALRTPAGAARAERATFKLPKGTRPGTYAIRLNGPRADSTDDALTTVIVISLGGDDASDTPKANAPKTLDELAGRFAAISRFDGVTVKLARPGKKGGVPIGGFRDPKLRLSGQVTLKLRVVP